MSDNPDTEATPADPTDTPEPTTSQSWEAQLEDAARDATPARRNAFDAARDATPARRNAFDAARKKTFLKALAKGATLVEAAKAACVGKSTVYEHQKEDAHFAAACVAAQKVIAPVVELAAFDRAVTGVEEDVISYGKHVGTRVKRSDALLQTLLKGSNPDKYGPQAGSANAKAIKALRKKWREKERKRLRQEIEAEIDAEQEQISEEEAQALRERIMGRFRRLREQMIANEGYTKHEETDTLVPPGWVLVPAGHSGHSGNVDDGRPERPERPVSEADDFDDAFPLTAAVR